MKKTAIIAVVVVVALAVALVAMRMAQGLDTSPAPLVSQKADQLAALKKTDADSLAPNEDSWNPIVRKVTLRDTGHKGVGLFIRHTFFRIAGGIGFDTQTLSALLVPTDPNRPVILDDPNSFVFTPLHGSVIMPPSALTALFNQYLTDYPGTQLRKLTVTTGADGALHVEGETQKVPGLWLPFTMNGPVQLVAGHLFVYKPQKIKIAGIEAKGLLKGINLQLSKLVQIDTQGAQLEGDNIVLDLNHSLPPPAQDVHVAKMTIDQAGVHLDFTSKFDPKWPEPIVDTDSYVLLDGGDIKNLRALVTNVRMQLLPVGGGKLDTSLYSYRQQLTAGYFKATTAGELVAYLGPFKPAPYLPPAKPEKDDDK